MTLMAGLAPLAWAAHTKTESLALELVQQRHFRSELMQREAHLKESTFESGIESSYVWEGATSEEIYNSIQNRSLVNIQRFNLDLERYRPIPTQEVNEYDKVSIQLEVTGSLTDVLSYLLENHKTTPPLASDLVIVRPQAEREQIDGTTQVSAQIRLWGYSQIIYAEEE